MENYVHQYSAAEKPFVMRRYLFRFFKFPITVQSLFFFALCVYDKIASFAVDQYASEEKLPK